MLFFCFKLAIVFIRRKQQHTFYLLYILFAISTGLQDFFPSTAFFRIIPTQRWIDFWMVPWSLPNILMFYMKLVAIKSNVSTFSPTSISQFLKKTKTLFFSQFFGPPWNPGSLGLCTARFMATGLGCFCHGPAGRYGRWSDDCSDHQRLWERWGGKIAGGGGWGCRCLDHPMTWGL